MISLRRHRQRKLSEERKYEKRNRYSRPRVYACVLIFLSCFLFIFYLWFENNCMWCANLRVKTAEVHARFKDPTLQGKLIPSELETSESQMLVQPCAQKRFSLVLPMHERDLNSFLMLWASLCLFLKFNDVHTFFIIVPTEQVAHIANILSKVVDDHLSLVTGFNRVDYRSAMDASISQCTAATKGNLVLLADEDVVPELRKFPWNIPLLNTFHGPGWHRQQMVKLAMASYISTQFYLTLDADVLVTRSLSIQQLIHENKGLTNMEQTSQHQHWWSASQQILGSPVLDSSEDGIGVTPAILHTNSVRALQSYLETMNPNSTQKWYEILTSNLRFTEYSMYYSFVKAHGLFDRFHHFTRDAIYQGANVWFDSDVMPFFAGSEAIAIRLFCQDFWAAQTRLKDKLASRGNESPMLASIYRRLQKNGKKIDPGSSEQKYAGNGVFMILNDGALKSYSHRQIWLLVRPYLHPMNRELMCQHKASVSSAYGFISLKKVVKKIPNTCLDTLEKLFVF